MALLKKAKPKFLERKGKWKKFKSLPGGKKATIRDAIAKKRNEVAQSTNNKSATKKSSSKKAAKKPNKAAASNNGAGNKNKKATQVAPTTAKPAKKFVRNRPNLGGKKPAAKPVSATAKYGTGTMVGGRQKFGTGINKSSKWMAPVSRGYTKKDLNGNQWHSKKDLAIIQKVLKDHEVEFYGKDGKSGIYRKLLNDPKAYNKTAHTLNLAADPTVKGWIDAEIKQNSSHTKRFAENFKESRFDAHNRTSPKAMKRRAKALFYTVQFGPDGRAK